MKEKINQKILKLEIKYKRLKDLKEKKSLNKKNKLLLKNIVKKIAKLNQKLFELISNKDKRNLYLHKSTSMYENKYLKFWSNKIKENDDFKIIKTIYIDKKDEKFFNELFERLLLKEEYNIFINDIEYYKNINKLIKQYNPKNEYKLF